MREGSPPPAASPVAALTAAVPAPARIRRKPRLRGWSHELAAVATVPAVLSLVGRARPGTGTLAAVVYGATLVLLFTVSAVYHRMYWPLSIRRVIGRIDHAAIFLLIAGTYTPFCLLIGGPGRVLLVAVWALALAGVGLAIGWNGVPKAVMAAIYVGLGWLVVPFLPALRVAMPAGTFVLLLLGGVQYTVGAAIYALRRPDPFPAVFGYHEIFHLLVLGAAACHLGAASGAIRALG